MVGGSNGGNRLAVQAQRDAKRAVLLKKQARKKENSGVSSIQGLIATSGSGWGNSDLLRHPDKLRREKTLGRKAPVNGGGRQTLNLGDKYVARPRASSPQRGGTERFSKVDGRALFRQCFKRLSAPRGRTKHSQGETSEKERRRNWPAMGRDTRLYGLLFNGN